MHKSYRRARTDYPAGVVAIYDNGGKTADRYTVVYAPFYPATAGGDRPYFPYVGMSGEPFHPQGFCQHGETEDFRPTGGGWSGRSSCGKVIRFEDLPPDCQKVVLRDTEGSEA